MAKKLRRWEQDQAALVSAGPVDTGDAAEPVGRAGDTDVGPPARPPRSASVAVWRAYCDAVGVDHTGMTKAEIIATV